MKSYRLGLALLLFAGRAFASSDLETAFQALQSAEKTNDPAQLKAAALKVYAETHPATRAAEPANVEEQEVRQNIVEYARYVESYTDHALYTAALTAPAAVAVDLLATLDQQSPTSEYLDRGGYGLYFEALEETGAKAKIAPIAEKAVIRFPDNPDILLVLANTAMARKQNDSAIKYARRLVTAANARAKQDTGIRTTGFLARGYWLAGVAEGERNDFVDADCDLRAALPLVQGNDAMTGAALFYLGVANYQLGKELQLRQQVLEAQQFSERAAEIKSPYSARAWENAQIIKGELAKWR